MRILLVEDSRRLRATLQRGLDRAGFSVDAVETGEEAASLVRSNPFDLVILDVMLPGVDGLTVLRQVREAGDDTPVLVLTARDATAQVVEGFEAGADDYMVKPFAFDELVVRCKALLRRRYGAPRKLLRVGDVEVDTTGRTVRVSDDVIDVTAREFKLLEALALRGGEVVGREELEDHVYSLADLPSSNAIDATIYSLRRKLDGGERPSRIRTVRGLGYSLVDVNGDAG